MLSTLSFASELHVHCTGVLQVSHQEQQLKWLHVCCWINLYNGQIIRGHFDQSAARDELQKSRTLQNGFRYGDSRIGRFISEAGATFYNDHHGSSPDRYLVISVVFILLQYYLNSLTLIVCAVLKRSVHKKHHFMLH